MFFFLLMSFTTPQLHNIAFFEKNKNLLSIFHAIHILSSKLDHKVDFFFPINILFKFHIFN
jgi:hypothetical protein